MDLIRSAFEWYLVKSQVKIKKVNQNTKKVVQKSGPNQQKWHFWAKKAPKSRILPRQVDIGTRGPLRPFNGRQTWSNTQSCLQKKLFQKILKLAIFSQKAFSAKTAIFRKFRVSQNMANLWKGLKSSQNDIWRRLKVQNVSPGSKESKNIISRPIPAEFPAESAMISCHIYRPIRPEIRPGSAGKIYGWILWAQGVILHPQSSP